MWSRFTRSYRRSGEGGKEIIPVYVLVLTRLQSARIMWYNGLMVVLQWTDGCLSGDRKRRDDVVLCPRDLVSAEGDDHAGGTIRFRTIPAIIRECTGFSWVMSLH